MSFGHCRQISGNAGRLVQQSLARLLPMLLVVASIVAVESASARNLETGFGDPYFISPSNEERSLWLDRAQGSGASVVRLTALWSTIAPGVKPVNPRDPDDRAYDFSALDAGVIDASSRGLEVLITVYSAPPWAEGAKSSSRIARGAPDPSDYPGAWKPKPSDFKAFATALTRRYSGSFRGLPEVRIFEPWNEPNLPFFLSPQRSGGKLVGPEIYRKLLNAFYTAAHAENKNAVIVGPATAPYGDPRQGRIRPAEFLRKLFCLKDDRKLRRAACPVKAKIDRLSHHPITTSGGPGRGAIHPDDVATSDMTRLVRILKAAERRKTVLPARMKRKVWATELWWSTNPPDGLTGVAPSTQARWIQDAAFRLWQAGVSVSLYYLIADRDFVPGTYHGRWAGSGVYFLDGRAKKSHTASRFPFVTRNRNGARLLLWTKPPASGRVRFEVKQTGGWKGFASAQGTESKVLSKLVRRPQPRFKLKLRAVVNGQSSLIWSQD